MPKGTTRREARDSVFWRDDEPRSIGKLSKAVAHAAIARDAGLAITDVDARFDALEKAGLIRLTETEVIFTLPEADTDQREMHLDAAVSVVLGTKR